MKKVDTKAQRFTEVVDGVEKTYWIKRCPKCGKEYKTYSKPQKFCSDECCKAWNSKKRGAKKMYDASLSANRLHARFHAIAVSTMDALVEYGVIEKKCCRCGSTEDKLFVHHINYCWADNTPSNLCYCCSRCHAEIHSEDEARLKAEGMTLDDIYDESFKPILSRLVKGCHCSK